jgi:DNA polymerase I-like protein with 3'-5' exonuclease and polymerase domains
MKEYLKKGVSVDDIPYGELREYLLADLHATQELMQEQHTKLHTEKNSTLWPTINLTNEVCVTLARIYQRGFTVDHSALLAVKVEFENEHTEIKRGLDRQVKALMGDTPVNLSSPEQLSQLIYSRKPTEKSLWPTLFDPFSSVEKFRTTVKNNSSLINKTNAGVCKTCKGYGSKYKSKKDGNRYKNPTKCATCNGEGVVYNKTADVAGLRLVAPSPKWVTANGFSTNKIHLENLENLARSNGLDQACKFLHDVRRLSALETYLSSFIEGINTHIKPDGRLHVRLTQHMTSTGRFSGRDPNMQNMPRGNTFPVKRVFISRFKRGKIFEADFAQLEFRTAAFLSQDQVAIKEVKEGFDVHSYTQKIISDAGQPITRQDAKTHTFAPLYGATGYGRTASEAAYYRHFNEKYKGFASWHKTLAHDALTKRAIRTPSGREFSFPDVMRKQNGQVSHFTQIKNYPVQSFATADIVPIALLAIESELIHAQSCIVNTVHDSIVIDMHPDEDALVTQVLRTVEDNLIGLIQQRWGVDFNVPLTLDAKVGVNWMETKEV